MEITNQPQSRVRRFCWMEGGAFPGGGGLSCEGGAELCLRLPMGLHGRLEGPHLLGVVTGSQEAGGGIGKNREAIGGKSKAGILVVFAIRPQQPRAVVWCVKFLHY